MNRAKDDAMRSVFFVKLLELAKVSVGVPAADVTLRAMRVKGIGSLVPSSIGRP